MEKTLYTTADFRLLTENENAELQWEAQPAESGAAPSAQVFHGNLWTKQDIDAERFSVKLTLQNEDYAAIAENFHFIPCIKQRPENICGAHVFRSPVAILSDGETLAALVPDVTSVEPVLTPLMFMDMRFDVADAAAPYLEFGLINQCTEPHTYYAPTGKPLTLEAGTKLPFYVLLFTGVSVYQALSEICGFLFETFAKDCVGSALPQTVSFDTYARYGNAFGESMYWEDFCGGGIPLSTFLKKDGTYSGREYEDDIWFHCWFNSMRTARELYLFGKRQGCEKWVRMAQQTEKLLVSAPQEKGLFPTIYAPKDGGWIKSSWQGGSPEYYSLPDCAWTAYQLMLYGDTCEQSEGAQAFLKNFADGLLGLALPDGTFPVWVKNAGAFSKAVDGADADEMSGVNEMPDVDEGAGADEMSAVEKLSGAEGTPIEALKNNAIPIPDRLKGSTASVLCALFLAEYALRHGGDAYRDAAVRYMDYIAEKCLMQQKFEDFELYYSCSAKKEDFYDEISRMYGQNTLAMQWTAESYLALYKLTREEKYLIWGRFALDLMSLYQQLWNPPYLSICAFGGFGVMNTDAEWNDARQAQFAETLANYYDATGEKIYFKRAVAALRGSFMLMVIDENAAVSPKTVIPRPWLNEQHGGMAENYGHGGNDERSGQSGFHWGSGSALVTAAEFLRRYGEKVDFTPVCDL